MTPSLREIAESATFQGFANCYHRECDPGLFNSDGAANIEYLEWQLPSQASSLRAEVLSHSLCGPHRFGAASIRHSSSREWRPVAPINALCMLVHEAYGQLSKGRAGSMRSCELELLYRVLDSYHTMVRYLERPGGMTPNSNTFIEAEQSIPFGHWLHPTPKSRQGMTHWQQPSYAPELGGSFQLDYFAARADLVRHASAASRAAPDLVCDLLGAEIEGFDLKDGEVVLPMHPLQAEALMFDEDIAALIRDGALRPLGKAGPLYTPTSSVRTLYAASQPWMIKFSLPVRITNSVRVNRRPELDAGVLMARLFARTAFCKNHPQLRIIHDPAYITLELPGRAESGFEVIFRENPFAQGSQNDAITIAALTSEPLPGEQSRLERIIRDLAAQSGASVADVSRRWFSAYLDCVLDPLIGLYDTHGVALEAHQQNSLLDVSRGYPRAYYYRDNQGFYLSTRYRESLDAFVPEARDVDQLYFDDEEIQDRFAYYLVINQVFSIICRMGHDGLVAEATLIDILRDRLEHFARTMTGSGRDFARNFLEQPTVAAKGNLMTRLFDIDELEAQTERAIYVRLPNPVFTRRSRDAEGAERAVAS